MSSSRGCNVFKGAFKAIVAAPAIAIKLHPQGAWRAVHLSADVMPSWRSLER
jgi:hypothetical protein